MNPVFLHSKCFPRFVFLISWYGHWCSLAVPMMLCPWHHLGDAICHSIILVPKTFLWLWWWFRRWSWHLPLPWWCHTIRPLLWLCGSISWDLLWALSSSISYPTTQVYISTIAFVHSTPMSWFVGTSIAVEIRTHFIHTWQRTRHGNCVIRWAHMVWHTQPVEDATVRAKGWSSKKRNNWCGSCNCPQQSSAGYWASITVALQMVNCEDLVNSGRNESFFKQASKCPVDIQDCRTIARFAIAPTCPPWCASCLCQWHIFQCLLFLIHWCSLGWNQLAFCNPWHVFHDPCGWMSKSCWQPSRSIWWSP